MLLSSDFGMELLSIFKEITSDKNYIYKVEIGFYIFTNNPNISVRFLLPVDSGIEYAMKELDEEKFHTFIFSMNNLYKLYKYIGYSCYYEDYIPFDDPLYIHQGYADYLKLLLIKKMEDELKKKEVFIHARASTSLTVSRIQKTNNNTFGQGNISRSGDNHQSDFGYKASFNGSINKSLPLDQKRGFHYKRSIPLSSLPSFIGLINKRSFSTSLPLSFSFYPAINRGDRNNKPPFSLHAPSHNPFVFYSSLFIRSKRINYSDMIFSNNHMNYSTLNNTNGHNINTPFTNSVCINPKLEKVQGMEHDFSDLEVLRLLNIDPNTINFHKEIIKDDNIKN